jgi:hypothetical protein
MFVSPAIAPIHGTSFARIAADLALTKTAQSRAEAAPAPAIPSPRRSSSPMAGAGAR